MSPVVVRSVLNISAAHTLAATPRAGVHKKAETAPGICLLADVTSGWSLCELHCHWTHDWCMCLPEKNTQPQPSRTSRVRKFPPPLPTALCSNPISWEVKKSQKMVEKLDHRGLPAVLLGSYCDQPWASKTQNCTRSYNLHMVRTQLNAQTGTKGLENSISKLENKGTASKHKEVRSSAEMPKQQIVWVAFLTAVVGLGMVLMGCLSSRWWGWSTLMGCCQSFGEKKETWSRGQVSRGCFQGSPGRGRSLATQGQKRLMISLFLSLRPQSGTINMCAEKRLFDSVRNTTPAAQ